jgi:hypothetical protein
MTDRLLVIGTPGQAIGFGQPVEEMLGKAATVIGNSRPKREREPD